MELLRWIDAARARMRVILQRRRADAELHEELAFHLAMQEHVNAQRGLRGVDATRRARVQFGGVMQAFEASRERRPLSFVETAMQDLRYAMRMMRKTPGFAAAAVVTLALGIGANTAIFSVLNTVILRPLAYPRPDRLMLLTSVFPNFDRFWVSFPEFLEFREWTRAFSSVGAYTTGDSNLATADRPQRVRLMVASADLFTTLGVPARLGRTFDAAETRPGGAQVVVLSHRIWQSAFGGDPQLLGASIDVDGVRRTVVGIMPPGFDVAGRRVDIWLPLALNPATANRGGHFLYLIGRLADGSTPAAARAELETLLSQWRTRVFGVRATETPGPANGFLHAPGASGHRLRIDPLQAEIVGNATTAVWVLQGAVLLVLLIACANLSTLLLSRAESRRKEFAVRAALGAARLRLLRQSIVEGCLLSSIGAALGIAVAASSTRLLFAAYPDALPLSATVALDWRVLAFTSAVAVATGVVFGAAPLVHITSSLTAAALKEGGLRATAGRHLARRILVTCEVALAVALVVGAGLLLRTVDNLSRVDAGFNRTTLATFGLSLPAARYASPDSRRTFYQRMTDQLASTPGILKVGAATGLPPLRSVNANSTIIEGVESGQPGAFPTIDYYNEVSTEYFDAMGIPIVEGRGFQSSDSGMVIVNETMARTLWRGQTPIGHRLRPCCNPANPWLTIVGVARDVKQGGVDRATGTEIYFHASRNAPDTMNIVLRTPLAPDALNAAIQRTVAALDPSLPVINLRKMEDVFDEAIGRPRLLAQLLTIFAMLALLLSTVGTYGVLSYMVTERRREIGIRIALGATRPAVMRMIVGQGARLTIAGLAIGVAIALAASRALTSLLFGVKPTDPATIAVVVALIGAVALTACYMPGLSATRVDPMTALRDE